MHGIGRAAGGTDQANCTGPGWLVGAQPHRHCHLGSKRVAGLWHTELWAQGRRSGVLALLSGPRCPLLLKATPVAPRSLPCYSEDRDCLGRAREVPAKMTGSGITGEENTDAHEQTRQVLSENPNGNHLPGSGTNVARPQGKGHSRQGYGAMPCGGGLRGHGAHRPEPPTPVVPAMDGSAHGQCLRGGRVALGREHRRRSSASWPLHGQGCLGQDPTELCREKP